MIKDIMKDNNHPMDDLKKIHQGVINAAYEIIDKKKSTYYGIGMALSRIVKAVLENENAILTVSTYLKDEDYGQDDIYIGVPAIINSQGVRELLYLELNEDEILKRVKKSMEMVGLNYEEYKDISPFELSGGQKRRVAIAGVIAMEPKVLILDEPINGLDPMGIVEIRELLKKINKEKDMTILISSHILSELSELATTYGIISNGKLIEEITAKQLSEKCRQYIDLKVDDTARAVILLERELGISDYEVLEDSNIKVFSNLDNVGEVNSLLSRSGIIVESISVKGENLEEYFMNKVGGVLNA